MTVAVTSTRSPSLTLVVFSALSDTSNVAGWRTVTVRVRLPTVTSNSPVSSNVYTYVSVPDSPGSRSNDTAPSMSFPLWTQNSCSAPTMPSFWAVTVSSAVSPRVTVVRFHSAPVTRISGWPTVRVPAVTPPTVTSWSPSSTAPSRR